jgi:hypothetical protein
VLSVDLEAANLWLFDQIIDVSHLLRFPLPEHTVSIIHVPNLPGFDLRLWIETGRISSIISWTGLVFRLTSGSVQQSAHRDVNSCQEKIKPHIFGNTQSICPDTSH